MTQESVAIDYQNLIREPTTGFKLYVLVLVIVYVVTCMKLIKVWAAGVAGMGRPDWIDRSREIC